MKDNKDVFMYIKQLGELFLYDILLSYIYPRVFVCQDVFESKYLFYEMESEDDYDKWLVTKITRKEYFDLVDKKKSIQSIYKNVLDFRLFSITKTYGEEDIITLNREEGRSLLCMLPVEDVYSEKEIVDDVAQETLSVARETGATTFDIRLFAGTDRHFIPQNILTDICKWFTSLTNSVFGQRRLDALQVATAAGSCIVRFSFPDQINLFNESNAINQMNIINDVLSSETLSDGLEKVKDQSKFVRSYSELLGTIRKTGSDVQFTTASPNSTKVHKVELTREVVLSRYNDVKDIYKIEKETVVLRGTLIALDIKTKKFKLQLKDGSIKSGVVANEFLGAGSFELPKLYDATLDIERYLDEKQNSAKEKYCLKRLAV